MKVKILECMNDLMQKNCICNFVIVQDGKEIYLKNTYSINAYMKAYEMSKNGNVECYMAVLGKNNKAAKPVFSIINGVIKLSGVIIK